MADTKLVICEKCRGTGRVNGSNENSAWSKTCEDCHGIGFSRVPMTNADRIRAMSDEELADWIARTQIANVAEALAIARISYEQEDGMKDEVAKECLEWLKQPAE